MVVTQLTREQLATQDLREKNVFKIRIDTEEKPKRPGVLYPPDKASIKCLRECDMQELINEFDADNVVYILVEEP